MRERFLSDCVVSGPILWWRVECILFLALFRVFFGMLVYVLVFLPGKKVKVKLLGMLLKVEASLYSSLGVPLNTIKEKGCLKA